MVARGFDFPGISMGLKEPQVLNDLLGWSRRWDDDESLRSTLDQSLRLLARPFSSGEATIIKPSNIVSPLADPILGLRPEAKAVFLYAPIESYLQSIAKKGLWGRRWVREVLIGTIKDNYLIGGFEDQDLLELTDLQAAAAGWLSQHALFNSLLAKFGSDRIKTLDSASLLAEQKLAVAKMFEHFDLEVGDGELGEIVSGPAFTTHSKDMSAPFDAEARDHEQSRMAEVHGEEIEKVAAWTEAVAASQMLPMTLPGHLLS